MVGGPAIEFGVVSARRSRPTCEEQSPVTTPPSKPNLTATPTPPGRISRRISFEADRGLRTLKWQDAGARERIRAPRKVVRRKH